MAKASQKPLGNRQKLEVLRLLQDHGRSKWSQTWQSHMALPSNLTVSSPTEADQENVLRYLLLRVLINQQAKFEKVREMSIRISEEFTDKLLLEPFAIDESELFAVFHEVAGEKGSELYKVGALGGIKPLSLFAYRFKAFEGFIRWLATTEQRLRNIVMTQIQQSGVRGLFQFLNVHPVLRSGWVGNDPKACRMFVNWVVFLLCEVWRTGVGSMTDTMMIVDGHVGKVFCRTGLLDAVLYESERPFIIQASKMRDSIEEVVAQSSLVPFYVDNGAFYLFEEGFCTDLNPKCDECALNQNCKKYLKWTAYQKTRG